MIIVTGAIVARPETFEALLEVCLAHCARSRREQGCLSHAVHIDAENPLRLVFHEEWDDRAALDAHFLDPDARGFVRETRELMAGGTPMKIYEATIQPGPTR